VTPVERVLFTHVRSFRRERGGLYAMYVAIYSRVYRTRMVWLHKRGKHAQPHRESISSRCHWCGNTP